nr:cytochrome c1 [Paracoccus sp. PARArs4]
MTMRTKTLTAALALMIHAGGMAWAQDAEATTDAPANEAVEATGASTSDAAPAPAEEAPTAPEAEEVAEDEAPAEEAAPAAEPEAEAEAGASANEEAAAEAPEGAEAPAAEGEPAAEAASDEVAADPAQTEATEDTAEAASHDEVEGDEAAHADDHAEDHGDDHGDDHAEGHGDDHADDHGDSHGAAHIEDISYSFEGPFGSFDQFQLQRGLQIYTEVCSACHGLKFVPIRTLSDDGGPGLPEDQVRAYAQNLLPIFDEDTQEERDRLPTDHFPAVTGQGMGPDLSLMAKARAGFHGPYGTGLNQFFRGIGGPEYIHAVLTGYTGEQQEQAGTLLYGNEAFAGGWISMAPPLSDDRVTYEDGTPATVDQMATDVAAFLMWTAEPKMMDRKMVGLVGVLFLIVLAGLLYMTNKRIWAPHKDKLKG